MPAIDYESILESLPGLYLILTPDFIITAVSEGYLNATMTERASLLGHNVLDVLPHYSVDKITPAVTSLEDSLNTVLKSGEPHKMQSCKYRVCKPGAFVEERYWAALNTPVFNQQQELACIVHSLLDDVETKPVPLNLKTSEKDYQLLVNSVRDYAIFMVDPEGRVASWNSGAESIKGYTAEEIIGKPIDLFYPEEEVKQKAPQRNLQMALKYGHYQTEGLRVRKDGTSFWANIVFTVLKDGAGTVYGYSKITRDITERKKSREQLEILSRQINQSNDAIFTTDTQRKIKSWNKGAENIYGYSSEEAIGKNIKDILKTPGPGNNDEAIVLSDLDEQGYWRGERIRKTKSGKDIYVRSSISVIKDDNGVVTGFVAVSFDITLQKQLGEQITHLASIVDQSSEAIISRGLDQRIITWNKGAENLLGYSRTEAIGKKAGELGMIRLTDSVIAELEEHIFEKEGWTFERQFYHKNGSGFLATVTANAVKNEQGRVTSLVFILKDISVRRQLEEQLKKYNEKLEEEIKERTEDVVKNEKRYRTLIENNHDIIALLDSSLKIIYRSPSAARITGWTDNEVLFEDVRENMHPEEKEKISKAISEVMANPGKPVNCLCRSRHKKGHYLWMEGVVINLLHDETVNAILFNFRDVTERVEAEIKLATSENLFRALIENSDDIISLMDESFKLVYRSPAAARITGWTNEDMLGLDATKNIHPADKPAAAAIVKDIMANPAKTITYKFRMQHKKGHYLWAEGTFTNLLHDKYIKAIVFNFRDVTERVEIEEQLKASERQYRNTLDNMLEGIQIHDFNWRYIYVNEALVKFSKYSREELLGYTVMEKYPGIEDTALFETMQRCMTERVTKHLETEFIFPDGSKADYELSIQPVPEGIFMLSIDITERKRIERELIEREQQLELFIEHSPVSLAMLDNEMRYLAVSRRWLTDYQLTDQQLHGKTHYEIFPGMPQRWKDAHRRCLNGAIEKNDEDMFVLPGGEPSWLRWEIRPWHKASGEIGGIIIFTEDITEKKIAERQKDFDTNNLNALINNTRDLMWSVDKDLKLITSNEAFDKLVMSMTGRIPGKGNNILLEEFSKFQLEQFRHYYQRAFSGEIFTVTEHDGSKEDFWSEISFYPIYEGKSVVGIACFSRNITEKKKSEQAVKRSFDEKQALAERMSAILNALPANIALLDAKGYIIDVNDAWRKFAKENGFKGGNSCIGNNYLDISRTSFGDEKEDGKKVADGLEAVLQHKSKEFVFEYGCHSPGIQRWFRMVATPLQDKALAGAVVMHVDITELRILEQERLKAKTEEQKIITKAILTGQERERNYIGRELHDNINQILTGTKIYLSLAGHKNKEVEELIKYPMELIDSSINEIRLLCHNMVAPLNNIHLQELVGDLIGKLQTEKTKAELMYAVPAGLLSEELQLNIYRIIQELVNNILKYAAAEQVAVIVKANDNCIHIMVTDDGKGFDPDKKRNGIGISNIINRVESFNGTITIESAPGNGCKTNISIPY